MITYQSQWRPRFRCAIAGIPDPHPRTSTRAKIQDHGPIWSLVSQRPGAWKPFSILYFVFPSSSINYSLLVMHCHMFGDTAMWQSDIYVVITSLIVINNIFVIDMTASTNVSSVFSFFDRSEVGLPNTETYWLLPQWGVLLIWCHLHNLQEHCICSAHLCMAGGCQTTHVLQWTIDKRL